MSEGSETFEAAAVLARISALWGLEYDTDLMDALSAVDDAERFMRQDFVEIERRIEAGELTKEWWSRDAGNELLQSSSERLALIRSRLESEHGAGKASKIIGGHFDRLEEWQGSQNTACPEIAVIATLSAWLQHADGGAIPCHSRIADLIESLRYYAPFFYDDVTREEKLRLADSAMLRPMQNVVIWRRKRTPYAPGTKKWSVIYSEQMEGMARFIFEHRLFRGEKVRVDRWIKKTVLPLTPGSDKSRSLFGAVKARKMPSSSSDE